MVSNTVENVRNGRKLKSLDVIVVMVNLDSVGDVEMPKAGACRLCRIGRFHADPEHNKWWKEWHVCFDCASICDLLVQQLVPSSERKPSNVMWPRNAYKTNVYKVTSI